MITQLTLTALILTLGAVVQTVAGFGIALVVVPLLLLLGYSLPESVALVIGGGVVQTVIGLRKVRHEFRWRPVVSLVGILWLTIPLGVLAMGYITTSDQQGLTKQVIGAMLLLILGVRLLVHIKPRDFVHSGWGWGAAAIAGFLTGLVGMGGPPLVLFAQAHNWSKDRFRGFLWAMLLLASPVLLLFLFLHAGSSVLWSFGTGLILAPFLWFGTWLAFALTTRWSIRHVQIASTTVLFAIALDTLAGPILREL